MANDINAIIRTAISIGIAIVLFAVILMQFAIPVMINQLEALNNLIGNVENLQSVSTAISTTKLLVKDLLPILILFAVTILPPVALFIKTRSFGTENFANKLVATTIGVSIALFVIAVLYMGMALPILFQSNLSPTVLSLAVYGSLLLVLATALIPSGLLTFSELKNYERRRQPPIRLI